MPRLVVVAHGVVSRGVPAPPAWIQGLAAKHSWMAFNPESGLPNELAIEQFLASELGETVERAEPTRGISIVRLQELFRSVLRTNRVEQTWAPSKQLRAITSGEAAYFAVTKDGRYVRLVPRLTTISAILGGLVVDRTKKDRSHQRKASAST
jgi:hypothetical protein